MTEQLSERPPLVGSRAPVRLLGECVVPSGLQFAGTTVGGLSGIGYDTSSGRYLLVSDDRSKVNPARFYTAEIALSADGIDEVTFTSVHFFRRPDGETYPSIDEWEQVQDRFSAAEAAVLGPVDPEEIRLDPLTGGLLWSQEGIPATASTDTPVLVEPALRFSTPDGFFIRDLPLPRNLRYSDPAGPRADRGLEAFTFARNGELVVSVLEDALRADGAESTFDAGGVSRMTVQTVVGSVVGQYAYELDPLPDPGPHPVEALPVWGAGNTGVTSVVAEEPATSTRFLVLERAFVPGLGNRVRIHRVDISTATDVQAIPSLAHGEFEPARKTLLVDLADLGLTQVQNTEGMTWGPDLPTGERTLLLIGDDNFSTNEQNVTQIVALAVG